MEVLLDEDGEPLCRFAPENVATRELGGGVTEYIVSVAFSVEMAAELLNAGVEAAVGRALLVCALTEAEVLGDNLEEEVPAQLDVRVRHALGLDAPPLKLLGRD